jgi:hypothetical protein
VPANVSRWRFPPLDSKLEALVIPFNAVLHDIHGGQWVYAQNRDHTYTRKRIQVVRLAGAMPCSPAARPQARQIVTDGIAELFGTEFMTGK